MHSVGQMVRHWRRTRRLSQLDLAEQAEVSTRHLSFIETGRSKPSREMVLVLSSALELPLRERNTLLQAAGFAPAYKETDLGAPEMAQVRQALELILDQPIGAVVFDRAGTTLMVNEPIRAMGTWLLGPDVSFEGTNLMEVIFDENGMKPFIVNWDEVARATLERLRREAFAEGDEALTELHDRLLAMPGTPPELARADWEAVPALMIPLTVHKDGLTLSWFTTLTTLGTPTDITLSELRIEQYYPADDLTRTMMASLTGG